MRGPRSTRRVSSTTCSGSATNRHDVRIEQWERDEVGDVDGKSLLHVQCHFGLDTLSWARLGASSVTGVDFSEPAIAFARRAGGRDGLAGRSRFLVSDVYDLPGPLEGETFDVVYTGRGALGWLPDLEPWARTIAGFVKPGGIFYIHEGHPVMWAIDDDQTQPNGLRLAYDYWGGETLSFPVEGSYADPDRGRRCRGRARVEPFPRRDRDLVGEQRVRIEMLDEKRVLDWPAPFLTPLPTGHHGFPPEQRGTIPLMYSLRARKA